MGGQSGYSFLDWMGDSGFRFGRGSSRMFVVCIVTIPNYEGFRASLKELKLGLGLKTEYHFHYAHIPITMRESFLNSLPGVDFHAAALVVDKLELPRSYHLKESSFICRFVSEVMAVSNPSAFQAKRLLVDSPKKDTELIRQIRVTVSQTLRTRELLPTPIIRGEPAARWDGLQLADMLAGTLGDQYPNQAAILPNLVDKLEIHEHL